MIDWTTLVSKWGTTALVPTEVQLAAIREIGPSGGDLPGGWDTTADVPCQCTTKDGRVIDFCVVSLFKEFPEIDDVDTYHLFLDEVTEIRPSEFALPKEIRDISHRAVEVTMGFAPTLIKTPDGDRYILNFSNYFFHHNGVAGRAMSLDKPHPDEQPLDAYNIPMVSRSGHIGSWYGPTLQSKWPLTYVLGKASLYKDEFFPKEKRDWLT